MDSHTDWCESANFELCRGLLCAGDEKGRGKSQQAHTGVGTGSRASLDYALNQVLKLLWSWIPDQSQDQFMNIPAKKPF